MLMGRRNFMMFFHVLVAFTFAASTAMAVEISDVTERWTFRYDVITAFPDVAAKIPKEENFRAIKVFQYYQDDVVNTYNERRVDVFYTGGDWMQYGNVYFVANSPNSRHGVYPDGAAAYFIKDLSTTDPEDGAVAPAVNPFDNAALQEFIKTKFLDLSGSVAAGFVPLSGE